MHESEPVGMPMSSWNKDRARTVSAHASATPAFSIWVLLFVVIASIISASALATTSSPGGASREHELDGRTILARATEATGGDDWANARTLVLRGRATFWANASPVPSSAPDSYVMYREFDPNRQAAHGAEGKLRIIVSDKGRHLWTVGYDGEHSWNDRGVIPKAEADKLWANNFGFGIIRHALKPGFRSERLPDGNVDGWPVFMVRLTDPTGTESLFGIDQKDFAIRMVGFLTPRGWHVRTYGDFFRPKSMPRWLQAGKVTLHYNSVKQNEIYWTEAEVNVPIDAKVFAVPPALIPPTGALTSAPK
jgi:hypothetical protein